MQTFVNFLGDGAKFLHGDEYCQGGDKFPLWQWIRARAFAGWHADLHHPPGGVWQKNDAECAVK